MNPSMHLVRSLITFPHSLRDEIESLLELEEIQSDRLKKIMSILKFLASIKFGKFWIVQIYIIENGEYF